MGQDLVSTVHFFECVLACLVGLLFQRVGEDDVHFLAHESELVHDLVVALKLGVGLVLRSLQDVVKKEDVISSVYHSREVVCFLIATLTVFLILVIHIEIENNVPSTEAE